MSSSLFDTCSGHGEVFIAAAGAFLRLRKRFLIFSSATELGDVFPGVAGVVCCRQEDVLGIYGM